MSQASDRIGLPPKPFLYTIDQLAGLLDLSEKHIKTNLLYYTNLSTGPIPRSQMQAVNIAIPGEKPDWRVSEKRLIAWLRFKGLRYHERGYVK